MTFDDMSNNDILVAVTLVYQNDMILPALFLLHWQEVLPQESCVIHRTTVDQNS